MRRKVTLSLDETFVRVLDRERGRVARSQFIEGLAKAEDWQIDWSGQTLEREASQAAEDVSRNPPLTEAVRRGTPRQFERSPEPESVVPREPTTLREIEERRQEEAGEV